MSGRGVLLVALATIMAGAACLYPVLRVWWWLVGLSFVWLLGVFA